MNRTSFWVALALGVGVLALPAAAQSSCVTFVVKWVVYQGAPPTVVP